MLVDMIIDFLSINPAIAFLAGVATGGVLAYHILLAAFDVRGA